MTDRLRRAPWLLTQFVLITVVFSLAYGQAPLFYSNQNQYLLHGFAIGGAIYGLRVSFFLERLGEQWMMRIGGLLMGLCLAFVVLRTPWQAEFINFMILGLSFYLLHSKLTSKRFPCGMPNTH